MLCAGGETDRRFAELDGVDVGRRLIVANTEQASTPQLSRGAVAPTLDATGAQKRAREHATGCDLYGCFTQGHVAGARWVFVITHVVRVTISELAVAIIPPASHGAAIQQGARVLIASGDLHNELAHLDSAHIAGALVVADRVYRGVAEAAVGAEAPTFYVTTGKYGTRVLGARRDRHNLPADEHVSAGRGGFVVAYVVGVSIAKLSMLAESKAADYALIHQHARVLKACSYIERTCGDITTLRSVVFETATARALVAADNVFAHGLRATLVGSLCALVDVRASETVSGKTAFARALVAPHVVSAYGVIATFVGVRCAFVHIMAYTPIALIALVARAVKCAGQVDARCLARAVVRSLAALVNVCALKAVAGKSGETVTRVATIGIDA